MGEPDIFEIGTRKNIYLKLGRCERVEISNPPPLPIKPILHSISRQLRILNFRFIIIRVSNHRKFFTWCCQTESTKSLELGWLILVLFNKLSFQISQAPLIQP